MAWQNWPRRISEEEPRRNSIICGIRSVNLRSIFLIMVVQAVPLTLGALNIPLDIFLESMQRYDT